MAGQAKHAEISRKLMDEIASGRYSSEGRLPSEAQLVGRFGVSRPTVARALRDLQEKGLIERKAGSGTYLRSGGAKPGLVASRQFGLLIPGLGTTEIFERISGELAALARRHEYGLLWGSGEKPTIEQEPSLADVEEWCGQFIQRQVSGVFFAPFEYTAQAQEINRSLADRLRQAGIAVVLLDRDLGAFPTRSDFDLVTTDNFAAGYLVAEHLLKLGARQPVFVARAMSAATISARIAGAREAILDRKLSIPAEFLRIGDVDEPLFIQRLAETTGLDAAICGNDQTAAIVIRGLQRKGVRVPQDVRVVGFDDISAAALLAVPLTTVHQPARDIAVAAFKAMLERMADPTLPARVIMLAPRLVIRESCGAYL